MTNVLYTVYARVCVCISRYYLFCKKLFFVTVQRYPFIERDHYLCVAKEIRPRSQHLINIVVFGYLRRSFNWIDARERRKASMFQKALDFVHLYKIRLLYSKIIRASRV